MATYVLVGGEAFLSDIGELKYFGQRVEMEPERAEQERLNGVMIIPAEAFDAIEFSPEHLAKYTRVESHGSAPKEFLDKKRTAIIAAQTGNYPSKRKTKE